MPSRTCWSSGLTPVYACCSRACRRLAVDIVEKILKKGTVIPDAKKVASLFDFISTIVEDAKAGEDDDEVDEEIEEEQNLVARLVTRWGADGSVEESFTSWNSPRIGSGGQAPEGEAHLPTVVFDVLQLVERDEDEERCVKMLKFLHGAIDMIAGVLGTKRPLSFTSVPLVADLKGLETSAYDCHGGLRHLRDGFRTRRPSGGAEGADRMPRLVRELWEDSTARRLSDLQMVH